MSLKTENLTGCPNCGSNRVNINHTEPIIGKDYEMLIHYKCAYCGTEYEHYLPQYMEIKN